MEEALLIVTYATNRRNLRHRKLERTSSEWAARNWALDLSVKDECKSTGIKKLQHFMGPEVSLPCSQEPITALS